MRTWIILGSIIVIRCGLAYAQPQILPSEIKGQLFFSEQERLILDHSRSTKFQNHPKNKNETIEFNGYVESSQGKRQVWVNRKMLEVSPSLKNRSIIFEDGSNPKSILLPGQHNSPAGGKGREPYASEKE